MSPKLYVISLWAKDVAVTAHFYRDVIGLRLLPQEVSYHDWPHFDLGGAYLTILEGQPIPPSDPVPVRFPMIAFVVDDLDAAVDRLHAHHVELPWGVEQDTESRWVMFRDPAGNLIELARLKR